MGNASEQEPKSEGVQVPHMAAIEQQPISVYQRGDQDEAKAAFEGLGRVAEVDNATGRRLLRKIDKILIPLLCIVYGLNFLDKTTLSYASIMDLRKDLNLTADNYSWLGSVFYFGYLGFELPAARLLQRLPLAKYSAFCIVAWGITIASLAAATNFAGAVTVRFFLGVLEASVSPGFILLISQDPITWAFVLFAVVFNIPNRGLTSFFNLLIESFGFIGQKSLLYGTPEGVVEFLALLLWGYMTTRVGNRIILGSARLLIALLGAILVVVLPAQLKVGRLVGYYLAQGAPTALVSLVALIATNVAGYTKKISVAGFVFIAYCVGNIIGPQSFRHQDAPKYTPAQITIVVCWGFCCLDLAFIYYYYRWQNTTKAAKRRENTYTKIKDQEWMNHTNRENSELVYEL